jgi:hypothetical protein
MEDSENGGKGEMQERNRTVVYLPREKVEREILSFWCTTFVVQVVPGLLTTLLSSGNTPGIDYGALAKIQNPWRRRRGGGGGGGITFILRR